MGADGEGGADGTGGDGKGADACGAGSNGSCTACDDHPDCAGHPEGNVCSGDNCISCGGDDQQCVGHPEGETCDGDNCTDPG